MNKETTTALMILLGLYLFTSGRASAAVPPRPKRYGQGVPLHKLDPSSPTLEQAGARLYEMFNSDAAHENDLPKATLTPKAVLAIAQNAGFPDPKLAAAIAMAESGGVTNALARSSREHSVGLWQINTMVHTSYSPKDMSNPFKNARAAFEISNGGTNWQPWTAYQNDRYRQFQTGVLAP